MAARVLGFNDEATVCDHCGKTELKGTYAVEEDGKVKRYGSVCISHVYGKQQGKAMQARADIIRKLAKAKDRSAYALQYLCWGTRDGWIIDGNGQKVIQA